MAEATANAGDTEVLDCMFAKAKVLSKAGNWQEALKAFDAVLSREKISTGKKIDATMEKAKIALFNMVTFEIRLMTCLLEHNSNICCGTCRIPHN